MKTILNYFFRGILIILPVAVTIYLAYSTIIWMNSLFNDLLFSWFKYEVPGLGIITGFTLTTIFGYLMSRTFARPIVFLFEKLMTKTPFINIVYNSLKDLTEAFVGERKKIHKTCGGRIQ